MKLVQINATCGSGSTGKICVAISKLLTEQKVENYILYASEKSEYPLGIQYMRPWEVKMQALKSRIFGNYGFNSQKGTKRLLSILDKIRPDIVHLHNLHGHNCNLEILFRYLKEKNIKVYWTFHDCWAFTGYCPHYDMIGCGKWQNTCHTCPQRKKYSWFFDKSRLIFENKKELFSELDLTIVTPSNWMADQVRRSFLHKYNIKVIHNGINLEIFKPQESNFRSRYHIEDKFILLGVAFGWGIAKGLDVFIDLAKRLDDRYQIVLVGTSEAVDKQLPLNIISIHRTSDQHELAEIYSAADLFVNPTREENFPTVNMEALACGTPVLTFQTGGSPEILNEKCGIVVKKDDVDGFEEAIRNVINKHFCAEDCIARANEFDYRKWFNEYIKMYGVANGQQR